jgi:hypothetical protein
VEQTIRAQGFEFAALFGDVYRPGTLAAQYGTDPGRPRFEDLLRGVFERLRGGAMDELARAVRPDLLLVSTSLP